MRVWNVGNEDITQLYNNLAIVAKTGRVVEVSDDCAAFLLNKKELIGYGLVQLKDGDSKEERYREGRLNIYNWAVARYEDYKRHCEEREAIKLQPLAPHKAILKFKATIDAYEKWVSEGEPVSEEFKDIPKETEKVFVCPHCSKEFDAKIAYFGHMRSHEKEKNAVNIGATEDTGQGKG